MTGSKNPVTRNPNTGPYVVSGIRFGVSCDQTECATWADACRLMRALLIDSYIVSVGFV